MSSTGFFSPVLLSMVEVMLIRGLPSFASGHCWTSFGEKQRTTKEEKESKASKDRK